MIQSSRSLGNKLDRVTRPYVHRNTCRIGRVNGRRLRDPIAMNRWCISRAAIKPSQVGRAIYRLFASVVASYIKELAGYYTSRVCQTQRDSRAIIAAGGRRSGGPMLDNVHDFLSGSSSSIVFFRGAASLSSLSSELSGARLRQLYWRPGERFAADNRNRPQTFRVVPAAISTFLLLHRYILFPPRAFPPAATNNTSARRRARRDDNKVVGKAIVRSASSSCPRSRDVYCTSVELALRQRRLRSDGLAFPLEKTS